MICELPDEASQPATVVLTGMQLCLLINSLFLAKVSDENIPTVSYEPFKYLS
jgi:hypothetical protein